MKKLIFIIVIVAAVALGITFAPRPQPVDNVGTTAPSERPGQEVVVTETYVRYPGESGKNAFELLQSHTEVGFKQYDFGVFVESIGGAAPPENHFWKLFVNGQQSQIGAQELQTKDGDVIEWKIEEINST